jgi:hypothetical protein
MLNYNLSSESNRSHMSGLLNFYTLDAVKKHCPKTRDEQVKRTGMPLSEHIGIFGKTGSMKSNTLLNLIRCSSQGKGAYYRVYMCVKKIEPFNQYLMEALEGKLFITTSVESFPAVSEFQDLSEENDKHFLIIFDDCITDRDRASLKKMQDYLVYGRSKGHTVVFLSQSYFQTDILIRRNLSWCLLCGISSNKELASIIKDYSVENIDKEQMLKMYKYCKSLNSMNFLKICCYQTADEKKFSCGFIDYLKPADF